MSSAALGRRPQIGFEQRVHQIAQQPPDKPLGNLMHPLLEIDCGLRPKAAEDTDRLHAYLLLKRRPAPPCLDDPHQPGHSARVVGKCVKFLDQ